MLRLPVQTAAILTMLCLLPGLAAAQPQGCATLQDPVQRADCAARAKAREAARAQVERELAARAPDRPGMSASAGDAPNPQWARAIREARRFDPASLVQPRPIAAFLGIAWLAVLGRRRWRALRATGWRRRCS